MENLPDVNKETQPEFIPQIPNFLPLNNMYTIQVGMKCFKISGASLSSDGPSYFTNYFSDTKNSLELLFIDRSPKVFDKIVSHLQGYYIDVNNCVEMIQLYSDACYFNFPRLKYLLENMDIFAKIGTKEFRIPRKLFRDPGNSPNFFTTSSEYIFKDISNVINDLNLIRPPVQAPILLTDRSSDLFEIILNYLQGNEVTITSYSLRRSIIKECRYYRFLGLEQKFVESNIFWDDFSSKPAILLKMEDIKPRQISINESRIYPFMTIHYRRPFLDDDVTRVLYFQTDSNLVIFEKNMKRVSFFADAYLKFTKAFSAVIQQFPDTFEISESKISIKFGFQEYDSFSARPESLENNVTTLSKRQIFSFGIHRDEFCLMATALYRFSKNDP